jgi:hypothetical protein
MSDFSDEYEVYSVNSDSSVNSENISDQNSTEGYQISSNEQEEGEEGEEGESEQKSPNLVTNIGKLFAQLNLLKNKYPQPNSQQPNHLLNSQQPNHLPDPPKPLLVMTNSENFCYDCSEFLKVDDEKGTGFGYLGINLYFCRQCYLTRFAGGEGEIIDYSEGIDPLLIEQYRQEFTYHANHCKNCFNCSVSWNYDQSNINDFKSCKGLIGNILIFCKDCQYDFQKKITYLRKEYTNKYNRSISDEICYYNRKYQYKSK